MATGAVAVGVGVLDRGCGGGGAQGGVVAVEVADAVLVRVAVGSQTSTNLDSARVWLGPPLACRPTVSTPVVPEMTVALRSSSEVVPGLSDGTWVHEAPSQ